jgi:hypothetical protein
MVSQPVLSEVEGSNYDFDVAVDHQRDITIFIPGGNLNGSTDTHDF